MAESLLLLTDHQSQGRQWGPLQELKLLPEEKKGLSENAHSEKEISEGAFLKEQGITRDITGLQDKPMFCRVM
ncbi:MAG: hypothetical protein FDX21_08860 [Chlorobium sp.]|nr:MAG: hypothetical protein FDX21_08860 [Chlorobium sp.]